MSSARDYIVHSGESDQQVIDRARANRRREEEETQEVRYAHGGEIYTVKVPRGESEVSAVLGAREEHNERVRQAQVQVVKNIAEKTGHGGEYELAGGATVKVDVEKTSIAEDRLSRVRKPEGEVKEQFSRLSIDQQRDYGVLRRESSGAMITTPTRVSWLERKSSQFGQGVWSGFWKQDYETGDLARQGTRAQQAGVLVGAVGGIAMLGQTGKVWKGAKAAGTVYQVKRAAVLERIGFGGKELKLANLGLTSEQAATKVWMQSSKASKAFAWTARTGIDMAVGTELIKAGTKTYAQVTTSRVDKELMGKYKTEVKVAKQEAYDKTSGGFLYNIQPLAAEKLTRNKRDPVYQETMQQNLLAQGVSKDDALRLSQLGLRDRKVTQFGELAAMVNIERKSELFGRKAFGWFKQEGMNTFAIRQGEKVGKFQLRMGAEAWKRQVGGVAVAGSLEGAGSYYAQQRMSEQRLKPLDLGISAGIGAASAAGFQYMIQAPAYNPKTKGVSWIARGAVEGLEGGNELMGDKLASVTQKAKREFTGRPIIAPTIQVSKEGKAWKSATFTFTQDGGKIYGQGGVMTPVLPQQTTVFNSNIYTKQNPIVDTPVNVPVNTPVTTRTKTTARTVVDVPTTSISTNVFTNQWVTQKSSSDTNVNVPVDSSVWDAGVVPPVMPFPSFDGLGRGKGGKSKGRKNQYMPSMEALLFNIKRPKYKKRSTTSGLEMRPV